VYPDIVDDRADSIAGLCPFEDSTDDEVEEVSQGIRELLECWSRSIGGWDLDGSYACLSLILLLLLPFPL